MTRVKMLGAGWRIMALVSSVTAPQRAFAASPESSPFVDVRQTHWAAPAVVSLARRGLINGYPDDCFRGSRPMTRYEVALALQRILQEPLHRDPAGPVLPRLPTTTQAPTDVPTSHWAADAVADAHRWGLLIGYPGSIFAGDHPVTRGEFRILLHRLRMAALQRLQQQGFPMKGRTTDPPTLIAAVGLGQPLTRYEFCVGLQRLIENLQHVVEQMGGPLPNTGSW